MKELTEVSYSLQHKAERLSFAVITFWDLTLPILPPSGQASPTEISGPASPAYSQFLSSGHIAAIPMCRSMLFHTPLRRATVHSRLVAPSAWMPVASEMTVTTTYYVLCIRRFPCMILDLEFTRSGKTESRERREGTSKEFPEGESYGHIYRRGKDHSGPERQLGVQRRLGPGKGLLQGPGKKRQRL